MKYTLEHLRTLNPSFCDCRYMLSQREVDIANKYVALIENTRSTTTPKAGDYLRYTDKYGDYHHHAHIEHTSKDRYGGNVCEGGSCAFVSEADDGVKCNGSGGPWTDIDPNKMKYVGKEKKTFWTWGSMGARAHGGIYFDAIVSVWEYVDPDIKDRNENGIPYTTREYDRFILGKVDPFKVRNYSYKYYTEDFGSGSSQYNHTFIGDKDLKAWLKTYRGVIIKRGKRNSDIVWCWKEIPHHVSPSEFEKLNAPIDTFMTNGSIMKCKRIYDEKNKKVHKYYVWYWKNLNSAMFQNHLRDKLYTYDWEDDVPEWIVARKELGYL